MGILGGFLLGQPLNHRALHREIKKYIHDDRHLRFYTIVDRHRNHVSFSICIEQRTEEEANGVEYDASDNHVYIVYIYISVINKISFRTRPSDNLRYLCADIALFSPYLAARSGCCVNEGSSE